MWNHTSTMQKLYVRLWLLVVNGCRTPSLLLEVAPIHSFIHNQLRIMNAKICVHWIFHLLLVIDCFSWHSSVAFINSDLENQLFTGISFCLLLSLGVWECIFNQAIKRCVFRYNIISKQCFDFLYNLFHLQKVD